MSTDLSFVIGQVISHTPRWVWGVLVLITVIGVKQLVEYSVSSTRLAVVPVALGAYSLVGACTAFGTHAEVIAAWGLGAALAVATVLWLTGPAPAKYLGGGRFLVAGSVWPLAAMWSVFAVRYVSTVTLIMHPGLAHGSAFSTLMPAVYGALSGLFMARALRILRSAPAAATLSLA